MADGKATKVFLPMETSGILSSVAALGEMFKESQETPLDVDEDEDASAKERLGGESEQPAEASVVAS